MVDQIKVIAIVGLIPGGKRATISDKVEFILGSWNFVGSKELDEEGLES